MLNYQRVSTFFSVSCEGSQHHRQQCEALHPRRGLCEARCAAAEDIAQGGRGGAEPSVAGDGHQGTVEPRG